MMRVAGYVLLALLLWAAPFVVWVLRWIDDDWWADVVEVAAGSLRLHFRSA